MSTNPVPAPTGPRCPVRFPALVGDTEKIVGAQPGLDVLEGDVVHFSPTEYGWPIVCSINRAVSPISISEKVTPSARASLIALFLVCSPVANPGNANARMSLRGRPSRSMAWVATISACVESNPRTHR